jgi:hypothetical protein
MGGCQARRSDAPDDNTRRWRDLSPGTTEVWNIQVSLFVLCPIASLPSLPYPLKFVSEVLENRFVSHIGSYNVLVIVNHFILYSMAPNLPKAFGHWAVLDDEANEFRGVIEKEKGAVESFKRQSEEWKTILETEQPKVTAFSNSMEGNILLQQATKQLLESIEHVQTTFRLILPSQQHKEVVSRIPASDQFVVKWQAALECLSTTSYMLKERLGDTVERARASQVQLVVHESLRAHAAQVVDRVEVTIRELNHSIDAKHVGILHPIRRVSTEIFQEIFEYAVDEEHAELMNKIESDIPSYERLPCVALNISATCRRWRDIATRTPRLWRHILAPWVDKRQPGSGFTGRTRFLRYLSLAGERGLELILRGEMLDCWKRIFKEECTKQWSHITIIESHFIPPQLPTPSRLSIYWSGYRCPRSVELCGHLVSSTMVLSCFKVLPHFTSPALKLTTLVIHFPYGERIDYDIGLLLSSLPSLSQLTLKCNEYERPRSIGSRTVRVHNTLKTLSIMSRLLQYTTSELRFMSIPSVTVLEILDLHVGFTKANVLQLFEAANSIKDTVTNLYISSRYEISVKTGVTTFIRSFSKLKRLELHGFAVKPGLEALWGFSMDPDLMEIIIKDYPEGKEKLREVIEAARPMAASWKISYRDFQNRLSDEL